MTIITHQTNIHLGNGRPTPSVTGAASGTTKWLDVDDGVAIFFSDADDVRRFAEALMEAAEGFAP